MKGIWHIISSSVVLLTLWILLDEITITLILIALPFTIFPDVDLKFDSHRNFLFHSIIIWVIVWWFNPSLLTALIVFGTGLHLLGDITLFPSTWKGYYTLKFIRHSFFWFSKDKRGVYTTIWLLLNFLGSVVILIIEIVI
jgi:hypothetical protein